MPQASAKSNTVQPDKLNEPIFTPRFIAGFAVNFILYMQYYALMVAMAGYSAMQFAAGATEGGFTASVFILGALCSRLFFGGVIDKVGRGRVLVACMTGEVACTLLYLAFEHVPAIGVFIVLRFLHGAFYGLSQTTVTSIVSSAVPFSRKGEGVGYYMLSVTLGAALGPLMGSAFSNAGDFDMLFFSCLGMIAVGYVAALGVVLPGRRQSSEVSKATGATEVAHSVNTAEATAAAEKAGASRAIWRRLQARENAQAQPSEFHRSACVARVGGHHGGLSRVRCPYHLYQSVRGRSGAYRCRELLLRVVFHCHVRDASVYGTMVRFGWR